MKQVQFTYESPRHLKKKLKAIGELRDNKPVKLLFQIYSEQTDFNNLNFVCNEIVERFPDAYCVGCSCNGSIIDGFHSANSITINCSVFEEYSTRIKVLQYVLNDESAKPIATDLVEEVKKRPWVKAVGVLLTTRGVSLTGFCEALSELPKDVQVFGGIAGPANEDTSSYVFSNLCGFSDESAVFILYGGDDLYVETTKISGWKPLGKPFLVTKMAENILWELDGKPAFEAYSKYLNIQNDKYFFQNTLEFPLFYYENGENLLRSPIACSDDGALILVSDMKTGSSTRIAYGDPESVMEGINQESARLAQFCPEANFIYSSVARKTFWGDPDINNESLAFNSIAPTSGYFAMGQILRTKGFVNVHNVTLVVAAFREGNANPEDIKTAEIKDGTKGGRVSVITRLANFTNVSSAELTEMYNKLVKSSITDSLTGLYNRGEIQRRIAERFAEYPGEPMCLIMIDIDNFKSVNDTFGHKEGDNVIVGLSNQIQMASFENAPDADAGRWGGEEFMIMLPDTTIQEAVNFAEVIRSGFAQIEFPVAGKKTISVGATELKKDDTIDSICVRVDNALYEAKGSGKNKVVVF